MRALTLLLALAASHAALAQPAPEPEDGEAEAAEEPLDPEAEEARILFEHGRSLAEDHRYAEAAEAFQQSLEHRARPSTRFNLALCLFALGRHVETLDALEQYVAEAPPEEAEGVIEARRLMALAQGRLSTLAVEVVPAEARVIVDGDPVDDPSGALRLDPGVHVLRVEATDHAPRVLRLELEPGERRRELVRLESTRRPAMLSLRVDRPASIYLDDAPVEALSNQRLEPGAHQLRVEAPGARWERALTLESGQHFEIDLALPAEPPPPKQWWQKPWPWLGVGVAIAGGVLAGVLLSGRTGDPSGGSSGVVLETGGTEPNGARITP